MADYQIFDQSDYVNACVVRNSDKMCIPIDNNNCDYIIYLAWVDAGNTPDPSPNVTQIDTNINAESNLKGSDWDVIKYRDQTDHGSGTDLTPAQYQTLLQERQDWRDAIV